MTNTPTGREIRALDDVSLTSVEGRGLGHRGRKRAGQVDAGKYSAEANHAHAGRSAVSRPIHAVAGQSRPCRRSGEIFEWCFRTQQLRLTRACRCGALLRNPWPSIKAYCPRAQGRGRVAELLEQVGLSPEHADRYPHQFSGGQCQRIAIARALALQPEVIICDEAVSALDVSVQAQVIQLLKRLRQDQGLSYLFVAHDLTVVRDFADRVAVMQGGCIVEMGRTEDIFARPEHPYTQKFLASHPAEERERSRRTEIPA